MTQLMNLDVNEQDILAQYMGHDINAHQEYYRLSRILCANSQDDKHSCFLSEGKLPELQGKSLDDIPIPYTTHFVKLPSPSFDSSNIVKHFISYLFFISSHDS